MNDTAKKILRVLFMLLRRTLLVVLTVAVLALGAVCLVCNLVFNGPSPAARDVLTMSLLEASATKWVPALFIGQEAVEQIKADVNVALDEEEIKEAEVVVNIDLSATAGEWEAYPDGIRIDYVYGSTYNAYVMLVRNPADVYLATSAKHFSLETEALRITQAIKKEGAIAAINAGAFNDDGTTGDYIGRLPIGLTISEGVVRWDDGKSYYGFAGFDNNNVLVVADKMSAEEARELGIRDGCCFGPVLIKNGVINNAEFSSNSGYNPRTAIGQRADGAVIFVCVDGRQAGSLGATYSDLINIMVEYGAVNACNLDGGASSVMLYRDNEGRYGEAGQVVTINNPALLQSNPRHMPTFFMVRPAESEE